MVELLLKGLELCRQALPAIPDEVDDTSALISVRYEMRKDGAINAGIAEVRDSAPFSVDVVAPRPDGRVALAAGALRLADCAKPFVVFARFWHIQAPLGHYSSGRVRHSYILPTACWPCRVKLLGIPFRSHDNSGNRYHCQDTFEVSTLRNVSTNTAVLARCALIVAEIATVVGWLILA